MYGSLSNKTKTNVPKLLIMSEIVLSCISSCKDQGYSPPSSTREIISSDAQLFSVVTQAQPFTSYSLFPDVDSVTSGTLNGSNAHRPIVRVSMNATALGSLRADTLPAGTAFPDGSIIFKQITSGGQTSLYAIIYKDKNNPLAGNGWLWAEFLPDGTPFISLTRKGANCTGCHSLEQGPHHDFVRTFERQGSASSVIASRHCLDYLCSK
jgi:hypothetical protein